MFFWEGNNTSLSFLSLFLILSDCLTGSQPLYKIPFLLRSVILNPPLQHNTRLIYFSNY